MAQRFSSLSQLLTRQIGWLSAVVKAFTQVVSTDPPNSGVRELIGKADLYPG